LKNQICKLILPVLLLLLAGCGSVTTRTTPESRPAEPVPVPVRPQEASPPPPTEPGAVTEPEVKPIISSNPAVVALLERAQVDNQTGRLEAAGASLERALRIEPRNPWLWHQLAQLRLTQGQYAQAISLARKSTTFAGQNRSLQALNWRLIGNARVAQGESAGAEQAFKLATELEQPGTRRGF
jgi:tetratricopeptide (TPR) repeat protein